MPGFDGTGPLGQGPMTGRSQGFCVLTTSKESPGQIKGLVGINGRPFGKMNESFRFPGKEVIYMPFGDGTGPVGAGPMTGRAAGFCAGYPVPGYANPVGGRAGFYGVGMPYVGRVNSWFRRGFGFGRGFGRGRGWGRGRGRFGY